jgi:hypothetical protein
VVFGTVRTYGDAYFTKAERRWLFVLRIVCALRGHNDRWVDWWNSTVLRCERCLQFMMRS